MSTTKTQRRAGRVTPKEKSSARIRSKVISKSIPDYSKAYESMFTKAQASKQFSDPFDYNYQGVIPFLQEIEPIYNFKNLITMYIESSILRQCIDAYVVNIESYGYVLEYIGDPANKNSKEANTERDLFKSLLSKIGQGDSLTNIRANSRIDYEVIGARCFEVLRDNDRKVTAMIHVPSSSVRLTRYDPEDVEVVMQIIDPENSYGFKEETVFKNFRRYAQKNSHDGKKIYFKEFGDPRIVNCATGQVDPECPIEEQATELLYDHQYIPGAVYGLPRWAGQLPSILGSKEAELVNYNFFRENAIPALAVLVSGGALTEDAMEQLENHVAGIKGRKSFNRILLLEAASSDNQGGDINASSTAPKIDLKPMISERQQEGLFQEYDISNAKKIRSAFRLGPMFVGLSDDYSRASADASLVSAESQVFVPERTRFDMIIAKVLADYGFKFWRFKSVGAPVSDTDSLSRIIKSLDSVGALTPNTVIKIANQVLNIDVPVVLDEWGDKPFAITAGLVRQGFVPKGFESMISDMTQQVAPLSQAGTLDSTQKLILSEVENILQDFTHKLIDSSGNDNGK